MARQKASLAAALCALLMLAPAAHADDDTCRLALGRGWPPATENYGTAVETLFAGSTPAALSVTVLPKVGAERAVRLMPDPAGGDWTLRFAEADERVRAWVDGQLMLRTTQAPEVRDVPIPATVAKRLVEEWRALLAGAAPQESSAPFSEDDAWVFVAGDLRVSGLEPGCDVGELLRDEMDLLIEATDEGPEKRQRRWRALDASLNRLRRMREAYTGSVANAP
ncbi:hypothetical protein [Agrilutibacter solisilvae]|uniref:Uncharacterized protein n=1 Tax=Agrilutibacter solisilvae TaxID=2763317 RepID=A0A974Y1G3_9GAMM|nr:hypothetical protein [Lysobacter solisilvae]QSX78830.1 hypothetical protein I8J32_002570 [Lysobacter solisilvae]